MRAVSLAWVLGALCLGLTVVGCSSGGEAPFDAGESDGSVEDGGPPLFAEDSASPTRPDGGDATLPPSPPSGDDSGSPAQTDSGSPTQADSAVADSALDSTTSADSGAQDSGAVDATTALCAGYNTAENPIDYLVAATSGGATLNVVTTDPTQNPVPADQSVIVTVQTTPVGIMHDLSVAYQPAGATSPTLVTMTLQGTGASAQTWTGTIPPLPTGEDVAFWVVGHDECRLAVDAGADYYSNSSANYHYETVAAPDAGVSEDAAAGDDGGDATAPVDAATDAGTATEDGASAADASEDDASNATDASSDASDASDAQACVSCGTAVTFLGNTSAYAMGNSVNLTGGSVPAGESLTAVTQTYPKGAAGSVHIVYATNPSFTGAVDLTMTFDTNQPSQNNDQWYGIIPAQASNTTVYWYLEADGCDCSSTLYDPGNFMNFTYTQD